MDIRGEEKVPSKGENMDIRNSNETVQAPLIDVDPEIAKLSQSEEIFRKGIGLSPEELLRKAEIAYENKSPLAAEQAVIFANSMERWLDLAKEYTAYDVRLKSAHVPSFVSGREAANNVYCAHQKFLQEVMITSVFLKAVARLGLKPLHDDTWALAALDFYHEDEDNEGRIPGFVFPSCVIRNWALTAFSRQKAIALISKWAETP